MKSIKEKAEEFENSFDTCYYGPPHIIKSFESGANYVLEQVERLIYEKQVKGNLPLFDLTYLIDELKKKQL